jgi:hypothetical protein
MVTERVYNQGSSLSWGTTSGTYPYYHSSNLKPIVAYQNTQGTYCTRGYVDTWYATNTSALLRAAACIPNLGVLENSGNPVSNWHTWNNATSRSTPGSLAGSTTAGVAFILSTSEVNEYFANTNAARQAMDTGGVTRGWWFRSPGSTAAEPVALVTSGGSFVNYNATNQSSDFGFRPALWLNLGV